MGCRRSTGYSVLAGNGLLDPYLEPKLIKSGEISQVTNEDSRVLLVNILKCSKLVVLF